MLEITDLPHATAGFNAASVVCLAVGFAFIRRGDRERHRLAMLSAVGFSLAFLVVYLIYHFNAGLAKFGGEGSVRTVYFTILIAHVIGAVAITPLVPLTLWRALAGRFDAHRRVARWTWPLWMYVTISGVVVYLMAIHLYPYGGA
jgi:putative membrane protein